MGIDDSGDVTSLVGLDGFVVCAQVYDGEQWWLAIETTTDVVRGVGRGRTAMAGARSRFGTCRLQTSRKRWCGPSGTGAARTRTA